MDNEKAESTDAGIFITRLLTLIEEAQMSAYPADGVKNLYSALKIFTEEFRRRYPNWK